MKKIALAASALFLSSGLYAAEFGLGASVNGDNTSTIYAPINVTKDLRVEPYVYLYDSHNKNSCCGSYDRKEKDIGVGVYNIRAASENTNVILGGRVGYSSYDEKDSGGNHYSEYGNSIAPVIGFEYFPVKNLAVGADASYVFTDRKGGSYYSGNKYSSWNTETRTSVTVKYFFQ